MRLILTPEQSAQVAPLMRPGFTMLGKVEREQFDGTNVATAGQLRLELGSVPTIALPALREAFTKATTPQKQRRQAKAPAHHE